MKKIKKLKLNKIQVASFNQLQNLKGGTVTSNTLPCAGVTNEAYATCICVTPNPNDTIDCPTTVTATKNTTSASITG